MHLQIFHTNHFYIKSVTCSNRPSGISSKSSMNKKDMYIHCLVVFTSIEHGDTEKTCRQAVAEIIRLYRNLESKSECNKVAVIPYSHQDNVETNAFIAYSMLEKVFKGVKANLPDSPVFMGDFGFNNEWEINVKSHKLSCLYRKL